MGKAIMLLLTLLMPLMAVADHHKDVGRDWHRGDLFAAADADKDGKVSVDEHEAMIADMAVKGRERFNEMDADSDGYVTKEEAKAMRKTIRERMKKVGKAFRKTMKELKD